MNMIRSAVDCQSESWPSPLFARMPRPQWFGMRPKRSTPRGVVYSPQTRLTPIESCGLAMTAEGGHCGRARRRAPGAPARERRLRARNAGRGRPLRARERAQGRVAAPLDERVVVDARLVGVALGRRAQHQVVEQVDLRKDAEVIADVELGAQAEADG